MSNERQKGGWILIVVLILITIGFVYWRYLSFCNLKIDCFDDQPVIIKNYNEGLQSSLGIDLPDNYCFRRLLPSTYNYQNGAFRKYLHPEAQFLDYLLKNQEKIILIKVN